MPTHFHFRYFPQLDGFRGLAILLVVTGHVMEQRFGHDPGIGLLGVLLFFVLSGFLITGLLQEELVNGGGISLARFYQRRALRLLPALFFYLAVVCGLIVANLVTDTPWYSVAACVLYVRNIWGRGAATGHIWSLSLEEQFYMVWPVMLRAVGASRGFYVAVVGAVAVSGFRMLSMQQGWLSGGFAGAYSYRPWFRMDSILIGCALALWLAREDSYRWLAGAVSSWFVPLLGWPALFLWTIEGDAISAVWKLTVQSLLAGAILLHLIVAGSSYYRAFFSQPSLRWFGRISYSWYLWQQIFTQYPEGKWGVVTRFPGNIAVSLALAVLSFRFVERPFLDWRKRMGGEVV